MKSILKLSIFILITYLVISFSACTTPDNLDNTKPPKQAQTENDTQTTLQLKTAVPRALEFNVKQIRTDGDDSITYPHIQLLTLAETTKVTADLKALHSQYKNEPMTPGTGAEELSYDEAYFKNKSLALIQTTIPMGESLITSQVTYDGEMVKVILERPAVPEGTTSLSAFGYWCIFVEINEKLPDTTTVSVETVITDG